MVAAISTVTLESKATSLQGTPQNSTGNSRPPLLPSERENGIKAAGANRRSRPRGREIPSRYMSPSCSSSSSSSTASTRNSTSTSATSTTVSSSPASSISRRFPSPSISRANTNSANPKRSQSADRRRSTTPRPASAANAGEISAASKLLFTSTRSLSVSFQGEAYSLPISKTKSVNSPSSNGGRKATPERRRSTPLRGKVDGGSGDQQVEGSKQVDQQLWPARNRQSITSSRSLDCSNVSMTPMRALHESLIDNRGRSSFDGILNLDSRSADVLGALNSSVDATSVNGSSIPSDPTASDTDSVSSGSTSGPNESSNGRQSGPRGIMASARFWQETNMRLRRLQDPGSVSSISPSSKIAASKLTQSRKFNDGSVMSPRMTSSPIRGAIRSASPSKLMTPSSVRGSSPSRIRSSIAGSLNSSFCDTPSVLSYIVDVRRGKVGENRIIDAHQLRLLYNWHLQWRFVNARTDIASLVQKQSVEKNLWNAWITITGLRDSVRHKRAHLQLLKQKLKLTSILKRQVNYLDEWSLMEKDHSSALQGAIEALKASTLRLPVVGPAIVDVQSVKEAVSSAVDVMQSMASSICSQLTKVEEVNSLVLDLVNVAAKERALLGQCKDVLSALAALEVKDCSLRTNVLQVNRVTIA
ncbi:hypothetical protein V2J09_024089 [Rumex salicifolius]